MATGRGLTFGGSLKDKENSMDEDRKIIYRRLLLAKQLFQHGTVHAENTGDFEKMIAIHNFHNALEITLKAICIAKDIPQHVKGQDRSFLSLAKEVEQCEPLIAPLSARLVSLNKIRNLAQHDAVAPSATALEECRVLGEYVLQQLFNIFFKISFDDLSPLELIHSEELRGLLQRSLQLIELEKYMRSLLASYVSFYAAAAAITDHLTQAYEMPFEFKASSYGGPNALTEAEKGEFLLAKMETLEQNMVLLITGISITDFSRFRRLRPTFKISAGGKLYQYKLDDKVETKEDVEWVQHFVVNVIVKWQSLGFVPVLTERYKGAYEQLLKERND